MNYQRQYIHEYFSIDGRKIPYTVFTAHGYLEYRENMSIEEIEKFQNENEEAYHLVNQIIALKQSCFLLRHVSYSCGSLSDDLYDLRCRLSNELEEKYNIIFDNDWMEKIASEAQRLV